MAREDTIDEHRRIIELYEISDKEFIESLKPMSSGNGLNDFGNPPRPLPIIKNGNSSETVNKIKDYGTISNASLGTVLHN